MSDPTLSPSVLRVTATLAALGARGEVRTLAVAGYVTAALAAVAAVGPAD